MKLNKKKFKNSKGVVGIDIAISVVVIFIFTTIIAVLIYRANSSAEQIKLKSTATYMAVTEIENVKALGFSNYSELGKDNTEDNEGNVINSAPEEIEGQDGFYKKIIVMDYVDLKEEKEIENKEDYEKIEYQENLVKNVTVQILYKFKGKDQKVEISTLLTNEEA